jgi:hypothetical protein
MRGLATRCRQNLKRVRDDLTLIEQFLHHYDEKS